jgi:hypothetical protein
MWVEQNQFGFVLHPQTRGDLIEIVIKLIQYETSLLLWNLQDQALRLLDVERCDENVSAARRDLYYVVTSAHLLALLVEHDSVLVKDGSLSVDDSA